MEGIQPRRTAEAPESRRKGKNGTGGDRGDPAIACVCLVWLTSFLHASTLDLSPYYRELHYPPRFYLEELVAIPLHNLTSLLV